MKALPAFVFVLALGLYLYTLAPSLNWGDGARLQTDVMVSGSNYWFMDEVAPLLETDGLPFDHLGVAAWDHPLYVMVGQVFRALPWREPAYRITLMSALAGALAVVMLYRVGVQLAGDARAAALGALAFALSHTFWFTATTAEVYTLSTLLMLGLLLIALRWARAPRGYLLAAFAFVAGLGLANHLLLVLTVLPSAVYMLASTMRRSHSSAFDPSSGRKKLLILSVLSFVAGFAPYWVQFIRTARVAGVGSTFLFAFSLPWLGSEIAATSAAAQVANLARWGLLFLYQFNPVGIALGIYGGTRLARTQPAVAGYLGAVFMLHTAFSANYSTADAFEFNLPGYVVFALALVYGISDLLQKFKSPAGRRVTATVLVVAFAVQIPAYAFAPAALRAAGWTDERLGIQPIGTGVRDALGYFLNPNHRGDDSAARFGRTTLDQLAPHALVFTPKSTDEEAFVVLRYFQLVEGRRRDVRLELLLFDPAPDIRDGVLAMARTLRGCRPLYLVSLNPAGIPVAQLRAEFDLVAEANLFRLLPHGSEAVCQAPERPPGPATLADLIRMGIRKR